MDTDIRRREQKDRRVNTYQHRHMGETFRTLGAHAKSCSRSGTVKHRRVVAGIYIYIYIALATFDLDRKIIAAGEKCIFCRKLLLSVP